MSSIEAIILGLIQGLTEFLPVSSSGHLTIAKALFGIETSDLSFEIVVHAATVLATIVVFRKEILDLLQGLFKFKMNEQTKYVLMICVSMIPVFIVGMFFKDYVEAAFGSGLLVVGAGLVITASLLILSDRIGKKSQGMTCKSALWMGLAQAVAVMPGLSRSGSTIATGLICGVRKEEVAKFSFLMVLVPILGEAFLDLVGGDASASSTGMLQLALGFVAAFVSGLFACKFMIAVVRKSKLKWFALYCCAAAIACVIIEMVNNAF
ncbi:MAG: undecaprenyl-diphosphate phosphatase [Bacteroidales bacterium]|nr:undecaprenyl-diphosphate phosphatase [Candidatus Cacconaster merdequi]